MTRETSMYGPSTALPSIQQSKQALDEARLLYGRTLSLWATDVLVSRSAGLAAYHWRREDTEHAWNRAA